MFAGSKRKKMKTMKPEFTVFKKGITDKPLVIVSKEGEPFNSDAKIQKYIALGYTVYSLDGKQLTK